MVTTVPAIEPGSHEIVISASGAGILARRIQPARRGARAEGDPRRVAPLGIKEMGEPSETTEPAGDTGPAGSGPGPAETSAAEASKTPPCSGRHSHPRSTLRRTRSPTLGGLALSGTIALAFLLLVGLPAELLESTIRSNYDRAFGWLARLRRRAGRIVAPIARVFANPWVGSGVTILAASLILGFADPDFGFNGASVRLTIALILSVLAINIGLSLIVMRVARRAFDVKPLLRPMPAALVLVALSVLVSRLAGISPGFLFGIVLGVAYMRELRLRRGTPRSARRRHHAAAGLLAWLGYGIASTASRARVLEQPDHRDVRRDHARSPRDDARRIAPDRLPRRADDLPLVEAGVDRPFPRDRADIPVRGRADGRQLGHDVGADLRMGHSSRCSPWSRSAPGPCSGGSRRRARSRRRLRHPASKTQKRRDDSGARKGPDRIDRGPLFDRATSAAVPAAAERSRGAPRGVRGTPSRRCRRSRSARRATTRRCAAAAWAAAGRSRAVAAGPACGASGGRRARRQARTADPEQRDQEEEPAEAVPERVRDGGGQGECGEHE